MGELHERKRERVRGRQRGRERVRERKERGRKKREIIRQHLSDGNMSEEK